MQVPFTSGGAEILTGLLRDELRKRGHQADIIAIPFKWYPFDTLMNSMIMGRMIDLTEVNGEKIDLVIAMKFPAYYLKHDKKILWLMHQHRQAYDLWATEFSDISSWADGNTMRKTIVMNDTAYMKEASKTFTIADNVTKRLKKFNGIDAVTMYPPPQNHDKLHCQEFNNVIFYPSRIDQMKRQRLLVEAARYLSSDATIVIAGTGHEAEVAYLHGLIKRYELEKRVELVGYISEEKKIEYYAKCLAVYFGAYDEDYGYITLEAFYSKKPVIIHGDAGGPLEFLKNGKNGFIVDADPKAIAAKIDDLSFDRQRAVTMGADGYQTVQRLNINWDYIINKLIA